MQAVVPVEVPGPLAPFALAVWSGLLKAVYTWLSARARMWILADLSVWMGRRGLSGADLTGARIDDFLAYRSRRRRTGFLSRKSLRSILDPLVGTGAIPPLVWTTPVPAAPTPFDAVLRDYRLYLTQERGLVAASLANWMRIAARTLPKLVGSAQELTQLGPDAVIRCVQEEFRQRPGQRTLIASGLRSLLRFLHLRGRTRLNLALAVPKLACWRLAQLPKTVEPAVVQALLQSCDRRTSIGLRDHAALLLLVRMGLRVGEVVALDLEDLRWRAGEIVVRGKGNREDVLPLPVDVGTALAKYLERGRQHAAGRAVFVGCCPPFLRLSRAAIWQVVHQACRRSRQAAVSAHQLRHTAASNMLRHGASLDEIGQVLRHRHADTTAIYAKVDRRQLREVARPWAGGGK